ncbi:response regulator [Salinimicrobium xinjiangense]|uniref:response regulator n=1 Tax=Salinimicrobium xinjiangense TaxID=438596 RepID=UPI001FE1557C|nr:response regulator [Salinimicrobium xinjiangense]
MMAKILIVEDDHNLGLMIQDILEFKGYDIILSRRPENTIQDIIENDVDLVLLDKLIYGVDGTDVCKKIRNTKATANIPVLMMSALHDARKICLKAGATDFIYKPFEMKIFQDKVQELLEEIKV